MSITKSKPEESHIRTKAIHDYILSILGLRLAEAAASVIFQQANLPKSVKRTDSTLGKIILLLCHTANSLTTETFTREKLLK